ncbi:MAG TPA: hypothetical protein VF271_11180, partial [Rhodanobacteraceae bacterium]
KLKVVSENGQRIVVIIQQKKVDKLFLYKSALFWGGDIGDPPESIIADLNVSRGDKPIVVPMTAYVDLGDVHSAFIATSKLGFSLHIMGGNTAGSYTAILYFHHECIAKRVVRSSEFPTQVWEFEHYSQISQTSSRLSCGYGR